MIGLENRKLQLELSMEERQRDISVHKDVQRMECKTAEEEKHQARAAPVGREVVRAYHD